MPKNEMKSRRSDEPTASIWTLILGLVAFFLVSWLVVALLLHYVDWTLQLRYDVDWQNTTPP